MNEQLQKALAEIITKVTSGADAAIQFSQEQIPEVLKQLLIWNFIQSLLSFVIPLILLFITVSVAVRFWKKVPTQVSRDNDGMRPWIVDEYRDRDNCLHIRHWIQGYASIVVSVILTIIILFNMNLTWLKIWLAPKLYLIEYAASLIK